MNGGVLTAVLVWAGCMVNTARMDGSWPDTYYLVSLFPAVLAGVSWNSK